MLLFYAKWVSIEVIHKLKNSQKPSITPIIQVVWDSYPPFCSTYPPRMVDNSSSLPSVCDMDKYTIAGLLR